MRNYIGGVKLSSPITTGSYLEDLPVVRYLSKVEWLKFEHQVTFLVGENGTGKSTLLEAIAVAYGFNPEGGSKNFTFSTNSTHSELYEHITLSKLAYPKDGFFLRAESLYNAASYIDELDEIATSAPKLLNSYGGKSLHHQSHGESFLSLVQNRFGGNGIYLLDEPEAALSLNRLMTLIAEIHRLEKSNSQFIIATHSPILMTYPNAQILLLSEDDIHPVSYRDTDHYLIARSFLENPEKMLKYLLEEDI